MFSGRFVIAVLDQLRRRETGDRKVFAGPRVRHLRLSLGLNQSAMARDLGISASYLNLVERNQRPLTTQLVLKLAAIYELDLRELHGDREAERVAELTEIFSDPVFGKMPSATVFADLVNGYPDIVSGFSSLYSAYRKALSRPAAEGEAEETVTSSQDGRYPVEEVRSYFHARNNYIAALDLAAEAFHASLTTGDDLFSALRAHLRDTHQIRVTVLPIHAMPDAQRRFDRHNRRLFLSEMLPASARVFQTAAQVALLTYADELERLVAEAIPATPDVAQLLRIALANYFAGALVMPYGRFIEAATSARYDLDVLAGRFAASVEQVAHRTTTLQRSERRGVPFFFLRIDHAGNVLKRISAGGFPFSRFGGICPRWRVFDCFAAPGETLVQHIGLPDGARYLTIARTVESVRTRHPFAARRVALCIGCDVSHAPAVVYADGLNLANPESAVPTGVACRVCAVPNCPTRAAPAMTQPLKLNPWRKNSWPFEFA
ncbi:MAG TPA: short-chain fatty acyl-CoA regulator family protein [Rhizomicrobium sp.]